LKGTLLGAPLAPVSKRHTESMEAYQLYLKGRAFWHKRFGGFLQRAMESFQQAIDKDPSFALAHVGLADAYITLGIWGFAPPRTAFPKATALVEKALALDETLAEAHASQGFIDTFYRWAWDSARQRLARALDLNPGSAIIHLWNGHYLSIVGEFDEAMAEVRHAQTLDPLSPIVTANVGWTLLLAHEPRRAIEELRRVLEIDPDNGIALFYLGFPYVETGRYAEAVECFRRAIEVTGGIPWASESMAWAHALAGDRTRAQAILDETLARMHTGYVPSSAIAIVCLGLGEDDSVFEWLERGVEERDALLPWLKFLPYFDRLHPDPRFQNLLRRIGLPER